MDPDARLVQHLRRWLGVWPPEKSLVVTSSPRRTEPGWDGAVHSVVGVSDGERTVLSVPQEHVAAVASLAADLSGLRSTDDLGIALERPGARLFEGVFRWSVSPLKLEDAGEWIPVGDPRVPAWLHPFGGEVLMAFDDDGAYLAGVGIKRHDELGRELAVVTEGPAQGRGLARRLVAQAARRVLDEGGIPTYLHADTNVRSAKVADAAGFPDRGWRILGVARG